LRRCGELEELHWRLNELGIDHAAGLLRTLSIIAPRFGLGEINDRVDFQVHYSQVDRAKSVGSFIVEPALVPNLASRSILICGVPHASIEDLVVSVVLNNDKPWYVAAVSNLVHVIGDYLDWEWIMEVLHRFDKLSDFKRLLRL